MENKNPHNSFALNGIFEKNHLYTLTDMIEGAVFAKLECLEEVVRRPEDIIQMAKDGVSTVKESIRLAYHSALQFECKGLAVVLLGFLKSIDGMEKDNQEIVLGELLMQAKISMLHLYNEEVGNIALMFLTGEEKEINNMNSPFGDLTDILGVDAMKDSVEAAKCLALNRWTASSFHTYRVMECAVHKLAKRMKVKVIALDKRGRKHPKGWGLIANDMLNSIGKHSEHKYFAIIKELIRVAKSRNDIDHAHKGGKTTHYTKYESKKVFNESAAFLRDLALLFSK